MTETRTEVLERWEREGHLVPGCPGCQEVYDYPEMPWAVFAPRHVPSERCESGKRPHCTCDTCW